MSRGARETWAKRVEALNASGLSVAKFAAEAKINVSVRRTDSAPG